MTIAIVNSKDDVKSLIHSAIKNKITADELDEIAKAILIKIQLARGTALKDPLDEPVDYIYDHATDKIMSIDFADQTYSTT
jgi:hypothetical protein